MKKIAICLLTLLVAISSLAAGQDGSNRKIYDRVASEVAGDTVLPMSELTVRVALSMLGTPYVGGTIEGEKEELRIFLDRTDCILFVETCVCMALTFKGMEITQSEGLRTSQPSYELFCSNVRNMRYRAGTVDGYASRLHYTSEWILQAEHNGIMTEYTGKTGIPRQQRFSFMSEHSDLYPSLKDNPGQIALIRKVEHRLDSAGPYHFVPQSRLRELSDAGEIQSGDIIFIISGADGLDISHVAIAYEQDGAMHFIHASSKAGKVIIEPSTLADYASRGIRAARLL